MAVQHQGPQDFNLQELQRFRVHRYPSLAVAEAEAATGQARIIFVTDTEEFFVGRQNSWRPIAGNAPTWLGAVGSEAALPLDPIPTAGEARIVSAGPHGTPALFASSGTQWVNVTDDNRLVFRDGSRAFAALPTVDASNPALVATATGHLITKRHYDTVVPTWFDTFSDALSWREPVANPAALPAAGTADGDTRATLSGGPSGGPDLYVRTGGVWTCVTDRSAFLDLAGTRLLTALPSTSAAFTPVGNQLAPAPWVEATVDTAAAAVLAVTVPATRQVLAGAGLAGGGSLSADRTLSVTFGTTPGTVCAGDDARLGSAQAHAPSHLAGGSDALAWGTIHGSYTAATTPAATAANAAYLGHASDFGGTVLRSVGGQHGYAQLPVSTSRTWKAASLSYAGDVQLAIDSASAQPQISLDRGATWASTHIASAWSACSVSFDAGLLLVAGAGQPIYTSANKGTSWVARDIARAWSKAAVAANGKAAIATVNGGAVYISQDAAVTWTAATPTAATWGGVGCSADGAVMLVGATGGHLFLSVDGGSTWSDDPWAQGNLDTTAISLSADGRVALVVGTGFSYVFNTVTGARVTCPGLNYLGCAMSADGRVMHAVAAYWMFSTDGGANWAQADDGTLPWSAIATTQDGSYTLTAGNPGFLQIGRGGWETVATRWAGRGDLLAANGVVGFGAHGSIPVWMSGQLRDSGAKTANGALVAPGLSVATNSYSTSQVLTGANAVAIFTGSSDATFTLPLAALQGATAAPVAFVSNAGTATLTIARAGSDTFLPGNTTSLILSPGQSMTLSANGVAAWHVLCSPSRVKHYQARLVSVNAANTDVATFSGLPASYIVRRVTVDSATISLTTATAAVFTGAGGTGTTVVAAAALSGLTAASKFSDRVIAVSADTLTSSTLYFRNVAAQGAAATVRVTIEIEDLT